VESPASSGDGPAFLTGRRVAEAAGLAADQHDVSVSLLDGAGIAIATRTTRLERLRQSHVLVVVITRACREVTCPGPMDPSGATACLGGRCVDPRCSPEHPELCGEPDCRADVECPAPPAACASARCVEGSCLAAATPGGCGDEEWCRPETGCEPLPDRDAGPADAGPPDAGAPDALVPDAGPPGPCLPSGPVAPDLAPHPPPPGLMPPALGETYVDPTFGTTIRRVTASGDAEVAESFLPAFNADSTRLLVRQGTSTVLYAIDPATGATSLVGPPWPAGSGCRFTEAFWSRTDPDVIFCHAYGTRDLLQHDVSTGVTTPIRTLTETPAGFGTEELRMGGDGVFALLMTNTSGTGQGAVVYDRAADRAHVRRVSGPLSGAEVLRVNADLSGQLAVLVRDDGLDVWDFRADAVTFVPRDGTARGCGGPQGAGRSIYVSTDCFEPGVIARRLDDPLRFQRILTTIDPAGSPRFGQEVAFSLHHGGTSFAILTHWIDSAGDRAVYDPWEEEILAVATDGSWVFPLAHHRSDVIGGGYESTPGATISYDGRFVAFTSNFGGPGHDVYLIAVPPRRRSSASADPGRGGASCRTRS
jgi:hypothetical protein